VTLWLTWCWSFWPWNSRKGLDAYNHGWVKDIKIWNTLDKCLAVGQVSELSHMINPKWHLDHVSIQQTNTTWLIVSHMVAGSIPYKIWYSYIRPITCSTCILIVHFFAVVKITSIWLPSMVAHLNSNPSSRGAWIRKYLTVSQVMKVYSLQTRIRNTACFLWANTGVWCKVMKQWDSRRCEDPEWCKVWPFIQSSVIWTNSFVRLHVRLFEKQTWLLDLSYYSHLFHG